LYEDYSHIHDLLIYTDLLVILLLCSSSSIKTKTKAMPLYQWIGLAQS
jgi:hypothetical protein